MLRKPPLMFLSLLLLVVSPHHGFGQSSISHDIKDEEMVSRSMFPDDFIFGVSTSAYQIEGAYLDDGKGLSNWDVFTLGSGNVNSGENGEIADDHYHRYKEDIEHVDNLGVDAYRFSISWARILPNGRFGGINPKGVLFYNEIIDSLLLKGIEPFVTIHHNDIPQELEDRYGGWLSPLMQEDFVYFAKTCFENFGDRVKYWMTVNEPNLDSEMGYMRGWFPPQHCSPPFGNCSIGDSDVEPLIAAHNILISHAKAVKLYRERFQSKQRGLVGITVLGFNYVPYRDDDFSRHAVERAFAFNVAWVLDPLVYGDYPPAMRKYIEEKLPKFSDEERELVKGSADFLGMNHYASLYAVDCFHYSSECSPSENRAIKGFAGTRVDRDGVPIGEPTGYERFFVVPEGMEGIINYVTARYPNIAIYVTENGYSPPQEEDKSEILNDFKRIRFYESYLASLAKAMRKGAKVKGFFAWTLMDNFEWLIGYNITYGLYYVDRHTLERIPKLSVEWYTDFLAKKRQTHPNLFQITNNVSPAEFSKVLEA